ncbi:MAG: pyridoxamine 5'-phosphate oxidase [Chloroflexi bacterium]|nr:pyridoxamine 5'-phosphate oxidase [Chloroflexota bacterium]
MSTAAAPKDPIVLFLAWFAEAEASEPTLPDAASLATVGGDGMPANRMVLVKRVSADGFEFHTNYRSRKGRELTANPRAALAYHWKSLGRSIRVEGAVSKLDAAASDAYWLSRPAGSRLSARASQQSEPVASRATLERMHREEGARLGESESARPEHWGGYLLAPSRVEFWTHRDDRLHERLEFRRATASGPWTRRLLQP